MSNELMVASTEQIEILEPEIVSEDKVFVAGRNWSSMDIRRSVTIEGHTIKEILLDQLRREFDKTPTEFQEKVWLSRCRCKVNGEEIEASRWDTYVPKAGEFVEFLVAPGKGGGGKNVLNLVLMLAVMVVAIYVVGPMALQAGAYMFGAESAGGVALSGATASAAVAGAGGGAATASIGAQAVAGMAVAATMAVGSYAVNKICPLTVSPQQSQSSQGAQSDPVYSVNGSSNSANYYGYVPLVLGRFRYSGPLGAKSWTMQIGDHQYYNMLVVWGHADMVAKEFRIGDTPLEDFSDVDHIFHNATTGNDLQYFNKSYNETSVGAALAYKMPVVRDVEGECDSISVDIYFPALADASGEKLKSAQVDFKIEYAKELTKEEKDDGKEEEWITFVNDTKFFVPAQTCTSYRSSEANEAWATPDGVWHVKQKGEIYNSNWSATKIRVTDSHWTPKYKGCEDRYYPCEDWQGNQDTCKGTSCNYGPIKKFRKRNGVYEWVFQDAWYDDGVKDYVTIKAATSAPVTRSFEWKVPERGKYKVRITRISEDKQKETTYDDAKWSVIRGILNQPAFNTPVPICCSELRIRGSEQLSGYVSDFNALCTSRFPIYGTHDADGEKVKDFFGWKKVEDENAIIAESGEIVEPDFEEDYVYGETVNPADHIRYLLTSQHALISPYTENKIDDVSLTKFAQYCIDSDYQFSLVCDSEASMWNRLTSVASAGRGAITTDNDGLFGVMIDNADKTVTQMFTPRNSWGFSIERAFYTLPHALRISYYDEEDDYKQKEGFVYADKYDSKGDVIGYYDKTTATDIVEWSMTGKTRWEDNYRMGRYYLASIKLRPTTITLSTDWEWMMCRRGDVVGVSHDVLLNTFGTARIVALIYKDDSGASYYVYHEEDMPSTDDALPVGVRIDDTVIFSEEATYGIAIRSKTGTVITYQIRHVHNAETADLLFTNSIVKAQCPYIGALVSVSTLGNETSKYLVASINVSDNNSAELTLVPWAMPEILESENSFIPKWEPPIYLPTIGGKGSLPAPTIRDIKSDESMLKRSGNSLIVCMGVWWNLPSKIDPVHGRIFVQGKIALASNPDEIIATNMVDSTALNYIEFADVNENESYIVKIRLIGDKSGVASDWSEEKVHVVVGRTTIPDTPTEVSLSINSSEGVEVSWGAVTSLDISHYEVSGDSISNLKTINLFATSPVYNRTGTLSFAVQAVDVLGLKSEKATASIEVLPPAKPAPTYTVEANRGTEVRWADCKTTWNINHYIVEDLWAATTTTYADSRFGVSPRPLGQAYRFLIHAVDVFGNHGPVMDFAASLGAMPAPVPAATVDGMQIVVSWGDVAAPFALEWYEVQTQEGVAVGKVKSTELRFEASKAGTHGYKVRGIDIAGNIGPWGECSIVLGAPKAPAVTAVLGGDDLARGADRIDLAWNVPSSSLPIVAYDVVHQWDELRADGVTERREEDFGRVDALALAVPPVPVGTHSYLVRAVDSAGVHGPWGTAEIVSRAPGKVTFQGCGAVDNNTMLYYTAPDTVFWRVKEYLVEDVQGGYSMEVGRVDVNFFARIENEAGKYTYGVTPVDVAGNLGTRATITINVTQPPDFILYYDVDSAFGGEKVNMELDGRGSMIGPIPSETWQENAERVAALLGTTADALTWQAKVDGGMEYVVSPAESMGLYSEVVDVGSLIPSTKIMVLVTQETLAGSPSTTCKIEVSEDGNVWRTAMENGLEVYEKSFRYIRTTFTWTGGLVSVGNINIRCDVKRKTDFGKAFCAADDNGEGWVSQQATPMLTGTFVPFNVDFVDVESLPKPNVVNDTSGLTAYTVFEDVHEPVGFRVFVLDKNGNRASATVDWAAYGV